MTDYPGIDYSMGEPVNRDLNTGIRYGIIHQHELLQAWADESEAEYPCEECPAWKDDECTDDASMCEPRAFNVQDDTGLIASCGSDGDIFVIHSPYFTFAQFCSPCAPGACHLSNPLDMTEDEIAHANCKADISNPSEFLNNKCYCFGHEWFWDTDDERAPYPVYSVETGELVQP